MPMPEWLKPFILVILCVGWQSAGIMCAGSSHRVQEAGIHNPTLLELKHLSEKRSVFVCVLLKKDYRILRTAS